MVNPEALQVLQLVAFLCLGVGIFHFGGFVYERSLGNRLQKLNKAVDEMGSLKNSIDDRELQFNKLLDSIAADLSVVMYSKQPEEQKKAVIRLEAWVKVHNEHRENRR